MERDIRFLLIFLILALAILIWLQNRESLPIPNSGSLKNIQHFTNDNKMNASTINNKSQNPNLKVDQQNVNKGLTKKEEK